MRTRLGTSPRSFIPLLAAILCILVLPASAQSNNSSKSQSVYLPDPTPRETDPHLLYGDDPAAAARTQATIEAGNARRQELIEWAANELVLLSTRVHVDVSKPRSKSNLAAAAADAEKAEQLAKSLKAALTVH